MFDSPLCGIVLVSLPNKFRPHVFQTRTRWHWESTLHSLSPSLHLSFTISHFCCHMHNNHTKNHIEWSIQLFQLMGAFYFMACGMKCFLSFKCQPQQQLEPYVPVVVRVRYHHSFIIYVSFLGPITSMMVRVGIPLTTWVWWEHVFCSVWWHPGGNLYIATLMSSPYCSVDKLEVTWHPSLSCPG